MKANRLMMSAAVAVAALGAVGTAAASDVVWSVGVHAAPGVHVRVGNVTPVYRQPAPVYLQPAPVYVQPAPVYYAPPAYYPPRPVYYQPRPVFYSPAPAVVYRGYGHRPPQFRQGYGRGHDRGHGHRH